VPGWQVSHVVQLAAAGVDAKVPGAHVVQVDEPGALVVPAGQSLQVSAFVVELTVPGSHAVHCWSEVAVPEAVTIVPGWQVVHATQAPSRWKKPGAQVMAQVSAVAALKAQIGAPF
jgi:hypothetical protein